MCKECTKRGIYGDRDTHRHLAWNVGPHDMRRVSYYTEIKRGNRVDQKRGSAGGGNGELWGCKFLGADL